MKNTIILAFLLSIVFSSGLYSVSPAITDADFDYVQDTNIDNKVSFTFTSGDISKISKYIWNFEGTTDNTITASSTTYTFPSTGTYYVCLTILDTATNKKTICKDVTVKPRLLAKTQLINEGEFNISAVQIDDTTYSFSSNAPTSGVEYYWNFDDGSTSQNQAPTHKFTGYRKYMVKLTIKEPSGRLSSTYKLVDIRLQECLTNFDISLNGSTIGIADYSAPEIDAFQIDFGDGNIYTQGAAFTSTSHTYSSSGIYQVTMFTLDEGTNCVNFNTQTIRVGDVKCNADFAYFVDTLFNSRKGVFYAKSSGDNPKYYWVFGDGHVYHSQLVRHDFTQPGYNNVSLTVEAGNCIDKKDITVLIEKEGLDCEADFMYAKRPDGYIQLFERCYGKVDNFIWRIGNDTIALTDKNPVLTGISSGIPYNVCLTITSGEKSNTTCKEVIDLSGSPCKADFAYFIDSTNNTVNFFNQSIGIDTNTISWDFGNRQISGATNPVINYADTGFYKIKFSANCYASATKRYAYDLIDLNTKKNNLKADFFTRKGYGFKVSGYPVDFIGISHGDAARMRWDFENDGIIDDSTSTSPTHVYYIEDTASSIFEVCYYIYDPILMVDDKYCDFIDVKTGESIDGVEKNIIEINNVKIAPNPMKFAGYLEYNLLTNSKVKVDIYNSNGTYVQNIINSDKQAGKNMELLNISNLPSGQYFVIIQTENDKSVNKIIKE